MFHVALNSIRYNKDYSLLILGKLKGYRIFLSSNIRLSHETTEEVNNLDNANIVMSYYK